MEKPRFRKHENAQSATNISVVITLPPDRDEISFPLFPSRYRRCETDDDGLYCTRDEGLYESIVVPHADLTFTNSIHGA